MMHTIAGTRITKSQYQIILKLRGCGLGPIPPSGAKFRKNPHSNVCVSLTPLAAVMYDWIVSPDRGDNIRLGIESIELWDKARLMFQKLWLDAYYILLD